MDAVIEQFPRLFDGFTKTLALLGIAGAGALVFGTLVAGFRVSPIAPLRAFAAVFTELVRNIPLTLVLFGFANLGPYLGARGGYFTLAAIGLTLYTTPFIAEARWVPYDPVESPGTAPLGMHCTPLTSVLLPLIAESRLAL